MSSISHYRSTSPSGVRSTFEGRFNSSASLSHGSSKSRRGHPPADPGSTFRNVMSYKSCRGARTSQWNIWSMGMTKTSCRGSCRGGRSGSRISSGTESPRTGRRSFGWSSLSLSPGLLGLYQGWSKSSGSRSIVAGFRGMFREVSARGRTVTRTFCARSIQPTSDTPSAVYRTPTASRGVRGARSFPRSVRILFALSVERGRSRWSPRTRSPSSPRTRVPRAPGGPRRVGSRIRFSRRSTSYSFVSARYPGPSSPPSSHGATVTVLCQS